MYFPTPVIIGKNRCRVGDPNHDRFPSDLLDSHELMRGDEKEIGLGHWVKARMNLVSAGKTFFEDLFILPRLGTSLHNAYLISGNREVASSSTLLLHSQ